MAKSKKKKSRGPTGKPAPGSSKLGELDGRIHKAKLEISRLNSAYRQRLNERRLFNRINQAIVQQKDLATVCRMIVKAVRKAGTRRISIFIYRPEDDSLHGIIGVDARGRLGDISRQVYSCRCVLGPIAIAIKSKNGIYFHEDIHRDRRFDNKILTGLPKAVKSHAVFALRVFGRLVGVMAVDDLLLERRLTRSDVALLKVFADQVAVVLENALMQNEARARIKKMADLTGFSSLFITVQRESILRRDIVRMTRRVFSARAAALLVPDADRKHLRVAEVTGAPRSALKTYAVPIGKGITGRVARSGKPLMANDLDPRDPLIAKAARATGVKAWAHMTAPILLGKDLKGVLIVVNPGDPKGFSSSDFELMTMLSNQTAMALENARIYEDTRGLYLDVVQAMVRAVEAKDPYTYGHSERVTKYSMVIGKALDLSPGAQEELRLSALLHDIGKIGVDDTVLTKAGRLDKHEWIEIRNHPSLGHDILKGIGKMEQILPGVSYHHERYSGDGYPRGLSGHKIPLFGRIIAVADAYDAMTSDRAYRKRLSRNQARKELVSCSGRQFDSTIVKAFVSAMDSSSSN